MSSFETIWKPDQSLLYVITSNIDKNLREIVVFPRLQKDMLRAQLCFLSGHTHTLIGHVLSTGADAARFIWDSNRGINEVLSVRPMTDAEFAAECERRRRENWAIPATKSQLHSWYAASVTN